MEIIIVAWSKLIKRSNQRAKIFQPALLPSILPPLSTHWHTFLTSSCLPAVPPFEMKSVTSSCIFEFLEIIVPQCSQERPVSGPRNYFDARHAVPGTALSNVTRERDSRDKPFLPFTPPLSSYDSKRLSTGRQRPTQAQLEVSGRPTLLWMDGRTDFCRPIPKSWRRDSIPTSSHQLGSLATIYLHGRMEIRPVRD